MIANKIQYAVDDPGWTAEQQADFLPHTLLTLARAKRELRVPPGDNDPDQDELIRGFIRSATSFVAEDLNIPLVSETGYVLLEHENIEQPLTITNPSDLFVLAASKVRYQTAAESYTVGDWPEEIEIGEENQIAPCTGDGDLIAGNIIVKPPGGTWPQAAQNHYALFYARGLLSTNKNLETYRQLVVLKMRDLFYGTPYMKGTESNSAYGRMAESVRFLGVLPDYKRVA